MYIGYNLVLPNLKDQLINNFSLKTLYDTGESLFKSQKAQVIEVLDNFVNSNGSLSGDAMEMAWFPQINADVFISHSHSDESLAKILAGLLYKTLGIKAFIDSCIWSYADDLLLMIDRKYCVREDGYYSYEKRNYSTSHVHMMLNTSLMKMMDKTECIIFLNTPSSISTSDVTNNTKSPWIYSEISMTRMLRRVAPRRQLQEINKGQDEVRNLQVEYLVDLDHLTPLIPETLFNWINLGGYGSSRLDELYKLTGGRPKTKITNGYFTK